MLIHANLSLSSMVLRARMRTSFWGWVLAELRVLFSPSLYFLIDYLLYLQVFMPAPSTSLRTILYYLYRSLRMLSISW